jgi:hypothetical protein
MAAEALAASRERAFKDASAMLDRSRRQEALAEKARVDAVKETALLRWT